ncbi:MAG: glycosyltransferase [Microcoleaceae cyanobacterium]
MKIALVHDYLTQRGGAERVFELLCRYFPQADVYTSLYEPETTVDLGNRAVYTTALQKIPGASSNFRMLAPFYYRAFRELDLQDYDLILSSSTSFAKAVRKHPEAKHICFCHNITRFLWDTQNYLEKYPKYRAFYPVLEQVFKAMRTADKKYAQEPDLYIANSTEVARRIWDKYDQQATVVNYPVDMNQFQFSTHKDDFCLVASRFLGYKRIDITIKAFNALGWPLKIIGDGPEAEKLKSSAADNIEFLGYVDDYQRAKLMAKARFVVVSALEDYGLVPVEANASGTPVIAYGAGGVLDTQVSGKTGLFFKQQTTESLQAALLEAATIQWNCVKIREHAVKNFSVEVFFHKVIPLLQQVMGEEIPVAPTQKIVA